MQIPSIERDPYYKLDILGFRTFNNMRGWTRSKRNMYALTSSFPRGLQRDQMWMRVKRDEEGRRGRDH